MNSSNVAIAVLGVELQEEKMLLKLHRKYKDARSSIIAPPVERNFIIANS